MRLVGKRLLCLTLVIVGLTGPALAQIDPLPIIDRELRSNYPEIESIAAAEVQTLMARGPKPVILDIRETDEYAVSHLEGALRVAPDAELAAVLQITGFKLKGRTIIVYCSVGMRSTELAARLGKGLKAHGAARIANLSQGIFGWHNAGRPLVRGDHPTRFVHPHDGLWGQLIAREELAHYAPSASPELTVFGTAADKLFILFGLMGMLVAAFALIWLRRRRQKA